MWIILALTSALLYAVATMFAKFSVSKVIRDQKGIIAIHAVSALILIGALWLWQGAPVLDSSKDLILALISGSLIGCASIFYFKAFNMEDASVVTLLTQLIVPFTLVLGFVFLGDSVTQLQILAAAVILAGVVVSTWSRKGFHLNNVAVLPIMLAATILIAAVLIISKSVINHSDVITYTFYQTIGYAVIGTLFTIFHPATRAGFKKNMHPFHLKTLLVITGSEVFYLLALLSQFQAFRTANAGLVISVGASEVFLSIILGYTLTRLFPHIISEKIDKKTIGRKVIAGCMIVAGIVLLNFVS